MGSALLRLEGIEKRFAGVQALKPLRLEVAAGEVLGLIGENGAGKSTLIKILNGVHTPDAGEIWWQGSRVRFQSPRDALTQGIATIHQELNGLDRLSVAENLLLGEVWPRRRWGAVDWKSLHATAQRQLAAFELEIPTDQFFQDLSPAQRQEVAIARALSQKARLLILDEPTASLSEPEVRRLFSHLGRLRDNGVALLYVSHRLDEILEITHRVAVLRDGELVSVYPTAEANLDRMVRDMVGRPLDRVYPRTRPGEAGAPLLEVENLTSRGKFADVTFCLRAGEIVGLAGLVGSGRSALARTIYGLYPAHHGRMRLCGKEWQPSAPHQAIASGLVYIPEERKRQALVLDHSVAQSLSIGFSDRLSRWGLIDRRREQAQVQAALSTYGIRARGPDQSVGTLSGGNQQKAVLARCLERDPQVVLLDEPTRGVDVGAKVEIHALMDRLAAQGRGLLFISSDLSEVLALSDRVLVMSEGRLTTELRAEAKTEENAIRAMSGLPPSSPVEPADRGPGKGETEATPPRRSP